MTEETTETLVGALIGDWRVIDHAKPGKRRIYTLTNARADSVIRLSGYRVVRLAREAHESGLTISMPREAWRNEA